MPIYIYKKGANDQQKYEQKLLHREANGREYLYDYPNDFLSLHPCTYSYGISKLDQR